MIIRQAAMALSKPPSLLSLHTTRFGGVGSFPRHAVRLLVVKVRPLSRQVKVEVHASNSTRLVTFVGKGGAGKTTAAVLAAQVRYLWWFLRSIDCVKGVSTSSIVCVASFDCRAVSSGAVSGSIVRPLAPDYVNF